MKKDLKQLFYSLSCLTIAGLLILYPHWLILWLTAGYFLFKATPGTIELITKYWKKKVFKKFNQ